MKATRLLLLFVWVSLDLLAQPQSRASKLTVHMGEVLEIDSDSLHIDTLIMQDNSRIVFLAPATKLVIENAFIGKKCTWDASGNSVKKKIRPGSHFTNASTLRAAPLYPDGSQGDNGSHGADGVPGRDLYATVLFRFLGELTIDTRGGSGRMGGAGSLGVGGLSESNLPTGGKGGDGGMGGDGGDGGTISLSYASTGFTPIFNEGGFRSIYFEYRGGKGGTGGAPGSGGPGGMPTWRYDYSNSAGVAVVGGRAPDGGGVPGKDGPAVLTPRYDSNPTGVVVEVQGQRGPDGGSGRMGLSGEDGRTVFWSLTNLINVPFFVRERHP